MLLHSYLLTTWRHLVRRKLYSAINVLGLSLGVAFCLLAWQFVAFERSFDAFHEKADRVFRVTRTIASPDLDMKMGITQDDLGAKLKEDFPQVVAVARFHSIPGMDVRLVAAGGDRHELLIGWADPEVFEILSFPVVEGDPVAALRRPEQVVLGQEAAHRLFGTGEAVGRTVSLLDHGEWKDLQVGAVVAIPVASTFSFGLLRPFSLGPRRGGSYVHTFLELAQPADGVALQAQMPAFTLRHFGAMLAGAREYYKGRYEERYDLQPVTGMHTEPSVKETPGATNSAYVWVVAGIALAVLLTAGANFVNLSMALNAGRSREVGLRKTLGAGRLQMAWQFWVEGVLFTGVALAAGTALAEVALPTFNTLVARHLVLDLASAWPALLALGAVVSLLTGAYPALALSRPRPAEVLRGRHALRRGTPLARILVAGQLALSVFLVAGVVVMARQMGYMLRQDLGFEKEHVVVLNAGSYFDIVRERGPQIRARFRELAARRPEILGVTASFMTLGQDYLRGTDAQSEGHRMMVEFDAVDWDFVETLGLRLVEGRTFSREHPGDEQGAVVVTQSVVRAMGWPSGVGHPLELRGQRTVVGVIEDFHVNSLRQSLRPVCLYPDPGEHLQNLYVRLAGVDNPRELAVVEQLWKEAAPELPFRYTFLDEDVARQYQDEERWGRIVRWGAGLAILIAGLGALALVWLAVARRTREIGIRKALGASAADVVALLSCEFAWLGLAGSLVAWPLAWLACQRWLQGFAYRIDVGPGSFLAASTLVIGVTLAVVASQALRASRMDPVAALRSE
ncbi:MAG: ABC transporter permease [Candidatus Latescibacterota bacterium]